MIYAVHILNGEYVKIGFCSARIDSRIAQLQTGSPFQIKSLFTVEGTLRQEKHLHYLLAEAFKRDGMKSMPPNEWYPGDSNFFLGFLFSLRRSVSLAFSYLQESAPAALMQEEKNRKREERFIKHNTNPKAVFKYKKALPDQVAQWPKVVRKAAPAVMEMIKSLQED